MSNLSNAVYMACFALMFVFAASISIYLYGTLNTYLDEATKSTNIVNRAEGVTAGAAMTRPKRVIDISEIYITLYNMEQMHINSLTVKGIGTVTKEQVEENKIPASFKNGLAMYKNAKFTYESNGTSVTYSIKN